MRGFTLIEMVIFIVLAALIIPAFFVATSPVVKEALTPTSMVKARFLGEAKMEEIMAYTIDSLPAQQTAFTAVDPTNFPGFQWKWTYNYVTCGIDTNPNCSTYTSNSIVNASVVTNYRRIWVVVRDPANQEYQAYSMVTRRQ